MHGNPVTRGHAYGKHIHNYAIYKNLIYNGRDFSHLQVAQLTSTDRHLKLMQAVNNQSSLVIPVSALTGNEDHAQTNITRVGL